MFSGSRLYLIPNQDTKVSIAKSRMHLAECKGQFQQYLFRYVCFTTKWESIFVLSKVMFQEVHEGVANINSWKVQATKSVLAE